MNTNAITVDSVLATLSRHIGKDAGINVHHLVYEITGMTPTHADERKLRSVVTELRLEGHHICAHPKTGYFIAANDEELEDTCRYLFDRGMKSLAQIARMKKVSLPDLHGQLKLLK